MKTLITFEPAFTPGAAGAGVLDFSAWPGFDTDRLYAVINVTRNTPIYIPGAPGLGAADTQYTKIFLTYDTSTHSATDSLNIYYDTANNILETNATQEAGGNMDKIVQLQEQVLTELRVLSLLLVQGLNIREELEQLRADIQRDLNTRNY